MPTKLDRVRLLSAFRDLIRTRRRRSLLWRLFFLFFALTLALAIGNSGSCGPFFHPFPPSDQRNPAALGPYWVESYTIEAGGLPSLRENLDIAPRADLAAIVQSRSAAPQIVAIEQVDNESSLQEAIETLRLERTRYTVLFVPRCQAAVLIETQRLERIEQAIVRHAFDPHCGLSLKLRDRQSGAEFLFVGASFPEHRPGAIVSALRSDAINEDWIRAGAATIFAGDFAATVSEAANAGSRYWLYDDPYQLLSDGLSNSFQAASECRTIAASEGEVFRLSDTSAHLLLGAGSGGWQIPLWESGRAGALRMIRAQLRFDPTAFPGVVDLDRRLCTQSRIIAASGRRGE